MKCPNCSHVSDTALLKCSKCGEVYDRAALETLQHLEYLLAWLDEQAAGLAPAAQAKLRIEALSQLNAQRESLRLPAAISPPPAPAPTAAVGRPPAVIARELSLIVDTLDQIQSWLGAQAIGPTSANNLREYLALRMKTLKAELAGRPAELEPSADLAVIDSALVSLPQWANVHGLVVFDDAAPLRRYLNQRRAFLLQPVTPPAAPAVPGPMPAAAVGRPPVEIARELALVTDTLDQIQSWLDAQAIGPASANNLRAYLALQMKTLKTELAGRPAELEPPSDLRVIDFALEARPQWVRDGHMSLQDSARLREHLNKERAALLQPVTPPAALPGQPPTAAPVPEPTPVITPAPTKPAPPAPAQPAKPPAPPIDWGKSWERALGFVLSGALLRGLLYLGAFMIVVSALVLVVVYWRVFPPVLQIGFIAALPMAFYLGGFLLRGRLKIPVAGGVFTGIGALLVAVDFVAIYQLGGLAGRVDLNAYWLAASVFCLTVYIFTAWRIPIEFFGYITLIGASSALLAFTRLMSLPLEWEIASVTASAVGMAGGAARFRRAPDKGGDLARAARRLPQILIPASLAFMLNVPGKPASGQAAAFLLAALGYGLLAWAFPGAIFAHAAVWSSIGAAVFALKAAALPIEWSAAAAAALAPVYLLAGRRMRRQLRDDFAPRRAYLTAVYAAGFGLLALAVLGGLAAVAFDFLWAGVAALALAAIVLAWCAYLFRRPALVLIAAGLFIAPFTLGISRLLGDYSVAQGAAWLMTAWAGLALGYLGLGILLRGAEKYGKWLNAWAHVLAPLALFGLVINYAYSTDVQPITLRSAWFSGPTLAALGGVILVYLASAIIHDSGHHPALSQFVTWLPDQVGRAIFLWPIGFLLPIWLAVFWHALLPKPWLGAALAGFALGYVGLGQLLARRNVQYRLPPHAYAYALAVAAIAAAIADRWALMTTLYLVVAVFGALAFVYRRPVETATAGLLFIWPFQLSLELSPLTPHAYSLAYALLASLGYVPLGIALDRLRDRSSDRPPVSHELPLYVIGYALSAFAVAASLLGRFGAYSRNVEWIGVVVPLIVTGLLAFSVQRFRKTPFAWAAAAVFPIAFGQLLTLLRVRPEYDATAWVGLAFAYMLVERSLTSGMTPGRTVSLRESDEREAGRRLGGQAWFRAFGWPLGAGAAALCLLGLSLTYLDTMTAFAGGRIANHFTPILAQMLAVGLTVVAARLYRSRWPLYLEPALAFFPATLFFIGYGERMFGYALTSAQFGIVWSALALAHLLVAALLDRAEARYSHGLYLGGYAFGVFAILWTLPDRGSLLWTLGLWIALATASAPLVHFHRHRAWDELIGVFFGEAESTARTAVRGAFLWLAAWPFPAWCVLLILQLNVIDGFYWLGLGVPAVLLLGLAVWLRRFERIYAWPFHTAAQFYTALGLFISAPLTVRFLAGQPHPPAEGVTALGYILLQTVGVVFYAASARALRWRIFAHLAAWLTFFPYTLAWILYSPLQPVQFALPWTGMAAALLGAGFVLDSWQRHRSASTDRVVVRYAHGPYLAGYVLAGFALLWSALDRVTNLYTMAAVIALALASHAIAHYGRHWSFDDLVRFVWAPRGPDTVPQRAGRTAFLFFAAYAFPVWLAQLMAFYGVPLAWRGLALALAAPIYVAFGLAARRVKREYTWPLFSAGYALTAIGAMVAFDNELLAIYVLALDAVVYAASAYIFRQAFWLYLSNTLVPIIALIALHYNGVLVAPWVAGIFMGLAFLYFVVGQWFERKASPREAGRRQPPAPLLAGSASARRGETVAGVGSFALPFYAAGYLLSAVALAVASGEKFLALEVFSAGVLLYALSAWVFREPVFLYPAAWLAAVPYYLGMTLTPLPPAWHGLGWLPLITGYIALGRFVFQKAPLGVRSLRAFFAALTHSAMPFYLLAYALSVSMMVLSQGAPLTLTLAFAAGAAIYLASAALFRRPVWLYPGLLAAHLAFMTYFTIHPTGRPAYYISLPFLGLTWVVALIGYWFSRQFPVVSRQPGTGRLLFKFRRWAFDFGSLPFVGYLVTPSWSQPFFIFTVLDIVFWQSLALYGLDTGLIFAAGIAMLLGLFATVWEDSGLPYGGLAFFLLAVSYALRRAGVPLPEAMDWIGGIGLGLYLLARVAGLIPGLTPRGGAQAAPGPSPVVGLTPGPSPVMGLAPGPSPVVEQHTTGEGRGRSSPLAVWLKPLTNAAMFLTALAVLVTLPNVITHTSAAAFALAFAGALYLAIAFRGRYYRLGYLAMAMLQSAWVLLLIVRDVREPQFYAIPAGLYFTGIGFLERRRARGLFAVIVESFGLALLLLTSFIQSLNGAAGFPHFLILLVEALLVIWWGASRRFKIPFFIGLGASALNVVAQVIVLASLYDVNRWIIFLGVGLLLVTAAVFVERQRERIIATAQEWLEALEAWG